MGGHDVSCSPLTKSVGKRCKRKMCILCFDLKTSDILKIFFLYIIIYATCFSLLNLFLSPLHHKARVKNLSFEAGAQLLWKNKKKLEGSVMNLAKVGPFVPKDHRAERKLCHKQFVKKSFLLE